MKTKCWKKSNIQGVGDLYKNRETDILIKEKNSYATTEIFIKGKSKVDEVFKNKFQALKFANKYMKEHDKC